MVDLKQTPGAPTGELEAKFTIIIGALMVRIGGSFKGALMVGRGGSFKRALMVRRGFKGLCSILN